jgi:hypothetical protein
VALEEGEACLFDGQALAEAIRGEVAFQGGHAAVLRVQAQGVDPRARLQRAHAPLQAGARGGQRRQARPRDDRQRQSRVPLEAERQDLAAGGGRLRPAGGGAREHAHVVHHEARVQVVIALAEKAQAHPLARPGAQPRYLLGDELEALIGVLVRQLDNLAHSLVRQAVLQRHGQRVEHALARRLLAADEDEELDGQGVLALRDAEGLHHLVVGVAVVREPGHILPGVDGYRVVGGAVDQAAPGREHRPVVVEVLEAAVLDQRAAARVRLVCPRGGRRLDGDENGNGGHEHACPREHLCHGSPPCVRQLIQ